jgi:hypothetical protein
LGCERNGNKWFARRELELNKTGKTAKIATKILLLKSISGKTNKNITINKTENKIEETNNTKSNFPHTMLKLFLYS